MVADKVADRKVADMELRMVTHMEVDKVADIEVDRVVDMVADIDINMGERVGHGGWYNEFLLEDVQRGHFEPLK